MSRRRCRALVLAAVASGCAGGARCPADRTCGAATWLDPDGVVEGRMAIAPMTDAAGPGAMGEALSVGERAVYLRFDLAPLAEAGRVDRAVLALAPHSAWRPGASGTRLTARGVLGPWSPAGVLSGALPSVEDTPAGVVTLPADTRGPVRVDVTNLVRAWVSGTLPAQGIALEATGSGAVFAGTAAAAQADRARLEVVFR